MKTKLLVSLFFAASVLAFSLSAGAQVWGPPIVTAPPASSPLLAGATQGTPLDPMAATLRIVPPRGGAVMLYRDGKIKGWYTNPGYASLQPGRVYGVMATRGSSMLFNSGVIGRRGLTEFVWEGRNRTPTVAHQPAVMHYGSYHAPSVRPRVKATPRSGGAMSSARFRGMVRRMSAQPLESQRLGVLRNYARRYRFTSSQANEAVRQFRTRRFKLSANRLLRGRTLHRRSPSGRGHVTAVARR